MNNIENVELEELDEDGASSVKLKYRGVHKDRMTQEETSCIFEERKGYHVKDIELDDHSIELSSAAACFRRYVLVKGRTIGYWKIPHKNSSSQGFTFRQWCNSAHGYKCCPKRLLRGSDLED